VKKKVSEAKQSEKNITFLFRFIGSDKLEGTRSEKYFYLFASRSERIWFRFVSLRSEKFLERNRRTLPRVEH
jgi:hypothetical protein